MSFEALKEAPPAVPIIFTTAYDEYAVQAFKYNSFDYLLKPIDADELAAAIEKVGRSGRNTSDEPLRQLFEALQQGGCRYRERFLLPYRDGYKTVSVREINHIFTENKIVRLHLDDGTSESVSVSIGRTRNDSSIRPASSAPTASTSSAWRASAIWATISAANSSCACTIIPTPK